MSEKDEEEKIVLTKEEIEQARKIIKSVISPKENKAGMYFYVFSQEHLEDYKYFFYKQYNEKVELEGGNGAYAWVEATDDTGLHFRPFYIGKNVSMFASEPTELKAVTEEQFNAYGFTLPAINLRKGGTVKSGEKTIFNAQLVAGNADVQEYGILVGTGNITEDMLNIENSGTHEDYRVLRAKSTRLVGANQFSIAINNLPDGYKYRGYVIYENGDNEFVTNYTDIM